MNLQTKGHVGNKCNDEINIFILIWLDAQCTRYREVKTCWYFVYIVMRNRCACVE